MGGEEGTAPRSNWLKVEEGLLTFCLNKYKGLLSMVYDGIADGKAPTNLSNALFPSAGSGNVRKLIAGVSLNNFQNVSYISLHLATFLFYSS